MKVLVTGGAGYIGSAVSSHLLAAGMEVTVFDKLVYGAESLLGLFGRPGFRWIRGDVRDRDAVRTALSGVSAVVHLAAVVGEPACSVDPAAAWSINYEGTQAVLAAAADCHTDRFIFISTCSNYGVARSDVLADEDSPLCPLSHYAESKVRAEQAVLASNGYTGACVLRFGTICGLSPRMRFDLLVSEMARAAAMGEPIHIFAPNAWRPFLHVSDAARAIAHCLSMPDPSVRGQVFNVVGENCQKRDLVHLVRKHYPETVIEIIAKQPDLRDYRVSGERIRQQLGFAPTCTVEEAFLETAVAVAAGVFRNPKWAGHSAVPLDTASLP